MPTENGSPLFAGFRSGARWRERRGAARGRRRHPRQDGDHRVRRDRAARHAQSVGFSRARRAAPAAAPRRRSRPGPSASALGTQVLGSILRPASFCGCYGFKPTVGAINRGGSYDGLSQSVPRHDRREPAGGVAASPTRSRARAGGDPGFPGLYGPATPPAAAKPAPARAARNRRLGGRDAPQRKAGARSGDRKA